MAENHGWTSWLSRAGGITFGVTTHLVFLVTVYFLFYFLRDGGSSQHSNWLFVDSLLAAQFAIVHSILLLPRVKKAITRTLPNELYGILFAAATCAGLWLIFAYWRRDHEIVWTADGWSKTFVLAGFYGSWAALFYSLSFSGFGYQTGWTQWLFWLRRQPPPRRGLVERGPYRWLRHPVYLSFLGLIWFTPHMTADHALLTAVWTIYIFVGSHLKDLRLEFYLGDIYRQYASHVPGFPGMFFGPLGKWKRREGFHPIKAASIVSPGPKANITHGSLSRSA